MHGIGYNMKMPSSKIKKAVLLFTIIFINSNFAYSEKRVIIEDYDSNSLIQNHLAKTANEKDAPVYVIKRDSAEKLGYDAIKTLNPDIDKNKPVLIKPNIGGFVNIKKGKDNGVDGRITNPDFVKGVIKYLKEKGVKDIAIGESWGVQSKTRSAAI